MSDDQSPNVEQLCDDLFSKDNDLRTALEVIVAAYRIHHIATLAVERIVMEEGLPKEAVKILTTAGAGKAKGTYYSIDALLSSVQDQVMHFLKAECDIQREAMRAKELETRMTDRVPTTKPPVAIKMTGLTVEVDRGRVMLAVGDKVKLMHRLSEIMYALTLSNDMQELSKGNPLNIINLSAMSDPPQIHQQVGRIMRIPLVRWRHVANSRTKMKTLVLAITSQLPDGVCDLIVVDDGNQLFHAVYGREPSYDLEDGLRVLRRIAIEMNAAVVCLAPIPDDCQDYVKLVKGRLQQHTEYVEV